MTSLSSQLNKMKRTQQESNLFSSEKKQVPSLLFDIRKAANFDMDTIFSIGESGYKALTLLDTTGILTTHYDEIFSQKNKKIIREKLTLAQNQRLSASLEEALLIISSQFPSQNSLKAMEYLLRNFEIHKYEAQAVVSFFMPYHATAHYTKLLQNISLKGSRHLAFLEDSIKRGMPISRDLIVKQCFYDITILEGVLGYSEKILRVYEQIDRKGKLSEYVFYATNERDRTNRKNAGNNLLSSGLSFAGAVSLDLLLKRERTGVKVPSENMLSRILNYANLCLKSSSFQAKISATMIFTAVIMKYHHSFSRTIIQAMVMDVLSEINRVHTPSSSGFEKKSSEDLCNKLFSFIGLCFQRKLVSFNNPQLFRAFLQYADALLVPYKEFSSHYNTLNMAADFFKQIFADNRQGLGEPLLKFTALFLEGLKISEDLSKKTALGDKIVNLLFRSFFDSFMEGYNKDLEFFESVFSLLKKNFLTELTQFISQNGNSYLSVDKGIGSAALQTLLEKCYSNSIFNICLESGEGLQETSVWSFSSLLNHRDEERRVSFLKKLKAKICSLSAENLMVEETEHDLNFEYLLKILVQRLNFEKSYKVKLLLVQVLALPQLLQKIRSSEEVPFLLLKLINRISEEELTQDFASEIVKLMRSLFENCSSDSSGRLLIVDLAILNLIGLEIRVKEKLDVKMTMRLLVAMMGKETRAIDIESIQQGDNLTVSELICQTQEESWVVEFCKRREKIALEIELVRCSFFKLLTSAFNAFKSPSILPQYIRDAQSTLIPQDRTFTETEKLYKKAFFESLCDCWWNTGTYQMLSPLFEDSDTSTLSIVKSKLLDDLSEQHSKSNFLFTCILSLNDFEGQSDLPKQIANLKMISFLSKVISRKEQVNPKESLILDGIKILLVTLTSFNNFKEEERNLILALIENFRKDCKKLSKQANIQLPVLSALLDLTASPTPMLKQSGLKLYEMKAKSIKNLCKGILRGRNELTAGKQSILDILLSFLKNRDHIATLLNYFATNFETLKNMFPFMAYSFLRCYAQACEKDTVLRSKLIVERFCEILVKSYGAEGIFSSPGIAELYVKLLGFSTEPELWFKNLVMIPISKRKTFEMPLLKASKNIVESLKKTDMKPFFTIISKENRILLLSELINVASEANDIAFIASVFDYELADICEICDNVLKEPATASNFTRSLNIIVDACHSKEFLKNTSIIAYLIRIIDILIENYRNICTQNKVAVQDDLEIEEGESGDEIISALNKALKYLSDVLALNIIDSGYRFVTGKKPGDQTSTAGKTMNIESVLGQSVQKSGGYQWIEELMKCLKKLGVANSERNPLVLEANYLILEIFSISSRLVFKKVSQQVLELFEQQYKEARSQGNGSKLSEINNDLTYFVRQLIFHNPFKKTKLINFLVLQLKIFKRIHIVESPIVRKKDLEKKLLDKYIEICKLYESSSFHYVLISTIAVLNNEILGLEASETKNKKKKKAATSDQVSKNKIFDFMAHLDEIVAVSIFREFDSFEDVLKAFKNFTQLLNNIFSYFLLGNKNISAKRKDPGLEFVIKQLGLSGKENLPKFILKMGLAILLRLFRMPAFKKKVERELAVKNLVSNRGFVQSFASLMEQLFLFEISIKETQDKRKVSELESPAENTKKYQSEGVLLKRLNGSMNYINDHLIALFHFDLLVAIITDLFSRKQEDNYLVKAKISSFLTQKLQSKNISFQKQDHQFINSLAEQIVNDLNRHLNASVEELSQEASQYIQTSFYLLTAINAKKKNAFGKLNDKIKGIFSLVENKNLLIKTAVVYFFSNIAEEQQSLVLSKLPQLLSETLPVLARYLACRPSTEPLLKALKDFFHTLMTRKGTTLGTKNLAETMENVLDKLILAPETKEARHGLPHAVNLALKAINILINNMKELMNPFVESILKVVIVLEGNVQRKETETDIENILESLSNSLEARILSDPLKNSLEFCKKASTAALRRLAKLTESWCNKMPTEVFEVLNPDIYNVVLSFVDYTREFVINKEENYDEKALDQLEDVFVNAFCRFALKTNEVQLRKYFSNFVTWSDKKFDESECGFGFLNYRKIMLFKISLNLIQTMTNFFVPFHTFIFDYSVNYLSDTARVYTEKQTTAGKKKKRGFERHEAYHTLSLKLNILILENFELLFEHDKEEFIDVTRFNKLIDPLASQYDAVYIPGISYRDYIENYVIKCVIRLFDSVNDDHKWKDLNYNILVKTRTENSLVKIAVLLTVQKLIEFFKERYAVLIQDLLPFLSETIDDENNEVEKLSKAIVIRLEQISGENIREYLKSGS